MGRRPSRPVGAGSLAALLVVSACAPDPASPEPVAAAVAPLTWVQQDVDLQGDPNSHDGLPRWCAGTIHDVGDTGITKRADPATPRIAEAWCGV